MSQRLCFTLTPICVGSVLFFCCSAWVAILTIAQFVFVLCSLDPLYTLKALVAMMYEIAICVQDLRDLEIPAMYEMLPADCHSAQHSYVLGPRAQGAGSKRADGVPSTHECVDLSR